MKLRYSFGRFIVEVGPEWSYRSSLRWPEHELELWGNRTDDTGLSLARLWECPEEERIRHWVHKQESIDGLEVRNGVTLFIDGSRLEKRTFSHWLCIYPGTPFHLGTISRRLAVGAALPPRRDVERFQLEWVESLRAESPERPIDASGARVYLGDCSFVLPGGRGPLHPELQAHHYIKLHAVDTEVVAIGKTASHPMGYFGAKFVLRCSQPWDQVWPGYRLRRWDLIHYYDRSNDPQPEEFHEALRTQPPPFNVFGSLFHTSYLALFRADGRFLDAAYASQKLFFSWLNNTYLPSYERIPELEAAVQVLESALRQPPRGD